MQSSKILILGLFILLSFSLLTPSFSISINERLSKHETPDENTRINQNFNITNIPDGSQIISSSVSFSLETNSTLKCVVKLNENYLNKIEISNHFLCNKFNLIELNKYGIDALQTKLNDNHFDIEIFKIDNNELINIKSNIIVLDIVYSEATYFKNIVNNIVVNVIVADQDYINTLNGTWVQEIRPFINYEHSESIIENNTTGDN